MLIWAITFQLMSTNFDSSDNECSHDFEVRCQEIKTVARLATLTPQLPAAAFPHRLAASVSNLPDKVVKDLHCWVPTQSQYFDSFSFGSFSYPLGCTVAAVSVPVSAQQLVEQVKNVLQNITTESTPHSVHKNEISAENI